MPKKLLNIGCWLMLAIFPISTMAGDAVGMLSATGTVLIDHQPAEARGAVFAGNTIETKARSKAVVAGQGKLVSLAENSSLLLGAREMELQSGVVVVSSASGVVTRVENATIRTYPGMPSKFLARKLNGQLQLLSLEGRIYVTDGHDAKLVPPNQGVSVALDQNGGSGGGSGSGGSSPAAKGVSWLANDDIGVLVAVSAAIGAGVALGIYNAKTATPPSP